MTISDPVFPTDDDPEFLTARINRLLEDQIRRSPADWLWAHNRWKPLRPHFLFARDQRRVFFPPDVERASLDPFRILVVIPGGREAADATLPALRAIKDGRPDVWLAVGTSADLSDLWKNQPEVARVIELSAAQSCFSLASKIRAENFDAAIFFSADWRISLAVRIAGIAIRVGRRKGLVSCLYNQHPPEPGETMDAVQLNLRIAQSIGANINPYVT